MLTSDSVQQQYNHLKIALDTSMDGIALLDAEGKYYYLNHEHLAMFGYEKAEELIGKSWQYIYNEDEKQRINKDIFPLLTLHKKWRGETVGKSKSGAPVYQEISLTLLEDGGMICICRNIITKIEERNKLQLHNEIMENTKSMIIITNPQQEIEWVNKSFCEISGYSLEECIGKKPGKLLQGKGSDKTVIAGIRQNILDRKPFQAELLNYKKDGTPYWIEIKGQPLFNNKGEIEHFFAIEEDITERKDNQLKLEESNIRLELALKGIAAATWELNLETGEVFYSDFLYQMTGYNEDEIGNLFKENIFLIYEDKDEQTFSDFAAFLKSENDTFQSEYRIKHKSGHFIWMQMRAVVSERKSDLKPKKIIGIAIDISPIKESQLKLQASENRYRQSMEATGAAIWEWDLINNTIYGTQEFKKLHGLPLTQEVSAIPYDELINLVHPDDVEMMQTVFEKHFKGEIPKIYIDYRFKRTDTNQYEWFSINGAVIEKNIHNIPSKAVGFSTSIQERKMMEIMLKESEERWFNAMVVSGAGFWEYDIPNQKFLFSTQMAGILNYSHSSIIPTTLGFWQNHIQKDDLRQIEDLIRLQKENKNISFNIEFRIINLNNEEVWISASGLCKFDENGNPIRYSGAAYNVTKRKLAELALENAKQLAESSVKTKRRFLANVSHEIRTPMHAIMGLSEQLALSDLRPEQSVLIKMISESSKALMSIINDVLDLSKIEEGKLTIDEVVFDPERLMQQVFELFQNQASKKQIEFTLDKNNTENQAFIADPTRIRQVMSNIISNAIKFTEKGKVAISFHIERNNEEQARMIFNCSDTGVGMSEEMKKKIFEEFVQEDESFHRKFGGSGLGLSITNELVKLMHGRINIQSKKNQGTTVNISIPLKAIHSKKDLTPANDAPLDISKLQKINLLVAEDNEFNRLLIKFILEKNKIAYDFAENGRIAVEKALGNPYDMILMDIQMPEMDGLEATQLIRQKLNREIPIIAITANAVKEELEYYLKNGLTDYLTKPFEEKKLLLKMLQFYK
ncbi:MAG: PAS domain S-box protein [Bacteroidota bacterium]